MNTETGTILAELRSASGLTQRQVAERMSANQTRVSRIEAGDGDEVDVAAYLAAVGTPEADTFSELLEQKWANLPKPSLRHPDLEALVAVESGLSRVREFLDDGQVPTVLAGQAQLLDRRLEDAGRYLLSLDHEVVYVGEIGVGKTTAACRQAGLVIDEATAADLKGMLLDTGGGRTTLCVQRLGMRVQAPSISTSDATISVKVRGSNGLFSQPLAPQSRAASLKSALSSVVSSRIGVSW